MRDAIENERALVNHPRADECVGWFMSLKMLQGIVQAKHHANSSFCYFQRRIEQPNHDRDNSRCDDEVLTRTSRIP
jgi:hypothetical protein